MGKDSAVQASGVEYHPPNLRRDRLHEQTVVPKPKDIPVKAVPITEIPFKAVPMNIPEKFKCRTDKRCPQKLRQKLQYVFRLSEGGGDVSDESFKMSSRMNDTHIETFTGNPFKRWSSLLDDLGERMQQRIRKDSQ